LASWSGCASTWLSALLPIDVGIHPMIAAVPTPQNNITAMQAMIVIGWALAFGKDRTGIFMMVSFLNFSALGPDTAWLLLNLIADYTADGCAAYRADWTAAGQYRTDDRTCTGTDCRIFFLRRHAGASRQAKHEGDRRRMFCQFIDRVHVVNSSG
jgi:hypothetical protein